MIGNKGFTYLGILIAVLIIGGLGTGTYFAIDNYDPGSKIGNVRGAENIWEKASVYEAQALEEEIESYTIIEEFRESEDSGYIKTDKGDALWENPEAMVKVNPETCTSFHCEHEWVIRNKIDAKTINIGFVMPTDAINIRFYRLENVEKQRPTYQDIEHSEWIEANKTSGGHWNNWTEKVVSGEESYIEQEYVDRTKAFASISRDGQRIFYTTNYQIGSHDINKGKFVYDITPKNTPKGFGSQGKWEMYLWIGDFDDPSWSINLDPFFYASFGRRQPITITNQQAITLRNYQVQINVTHDSDMQTGFQDVRFTWLNDTSGLEQQIGHWVERNVSSTYADIFIGVPEITASASETVFIYYKNQTSITDLSNGTATFLWFDDFEDNDITDWDSTNTPTTFAINTTTPYQGIRALTCGGDASGSDSQCWRNITSFVDNTQQIILHYGTRETVFSGSNVLVSNVNKSTGEVSIIDNVAFEFKWSNGATEPQIRAKNANEWYRVEMMVDLVNNNASARINGTFDAGANYATTANVDRFGIVELRNRASDAGRGDWDLFYIRNFTGHYGNQPNSTFGAEQTSFGWQINLNAPTNNFVNTTINGNTTFFGTALNFNNATAILNNASVYSNLTGTFEFRRANTTSLANNTQFGITDQEYPEGRYIWNIRLCGDDGGIQCVFNATNFTYIVDASAPLVSAQNPTGEFNQNTSIPINFTASDPVSGLSQCKYRIDGGANVSLPSCSNTTFGLASQGNHTFQVFANNTGGLENSSSTNFSWIGLNNYTIRDIDDNSLLNALVEVANATTSISRSATGGFVTFKWDELPRGATNTTAILSGYATNTTFNRTIDNFTLFNDTIFLRKAGLELRVFDEKTLAQLVFNVTLSNSTTTVDFTNQTILIANVSQIPLGEITIEPKNFSAGYEQRFFFTTTGLLLRPNVTAYLIKSVDSVDVTFTVKTFTDQAIQGALITIRKTISGTPTVIAQALTDSTGKATIALDPSVTYTIDVSKSGFTPITDFSYKPSSPFAETFILGEETPIDTDTQFQGLTYRFEPQGSFFIMRNGTGEIDLFVNGDNLNWWLLNLTYNGSSIFLENRTTSTGGMINGTFNMTDFLNLTETFDPSEFTPKNITAIFKFNRVGEATFTVMKNYNMIEDGGLFSLLRNAPFATGTKAFIWMIIVLITGAIAAFSTRNPLITGIVVLAFMGIGVAINWLPWLLVAMAILAVIGVALAFRLGG